MAELQEQFFDTDRVRWLRWVPALHLLRAAQLAACPVNWLMGLVMIFTITSATEMQWIDVSPPVVQTAPISAFSYLCYSFMFSLQVLLQTFTLIPRLMLHSPVTGSLIGLAGLLAGYWISRQTVSLFQLDRSQSPNAVVNSLLQNLASWGTAIAMSLATLVAMVLPCLLVVWLSSSVSESAYESFQENGQIWRLLPHLFRSAFGLLALVCSLVIFVAMTFQPVYLAAEHCDGFEAFSRSIQLILSRWRALALLLLVSLVSGVFTLMILNLMINLLLNVAGADHALFSKMPYELKLVDDLEIWLLLKTGYAYSFWWVTLTLSFFILRQSVESTPVGESVLTKS